LTGAERQGGKPFPALAESWETVPLPVQKGRHAMNATCSNMTEPTMAASSAKDQAMPTDRTNNFLYQAATVLAILLFLVSF